jgi:hypothetical protein
VEGNYFGVPKETLEKDSELSNRLASLTTARTILPQTIDKERFSDLTKQLKNLESNHSVMRGRRYAHQGPAFRSPRG